MGSCIECDHSAFDQFIRYVDGHPVKMSERWHDTHFTIRELIHEFFFRGQYGSPGFSHFSQVIHINIQVRRENSHS